jgi:hypothetical protein
MVRTFVNVTIYSQYNNNNNNKNPRKIKERTKYNNTALFFGFSFFGGDTGV